MRNYCRRKIQPKSTAFLLIKARGSSVKTRYLQLSDIRKQRFKTRRKAQKMVRSIRPSITLTVFASPTMATYFPKSLGSKTLVLKTPIKLWEDPLLKGARGKTLVPLFFTTQDESPVGLKCNHRLSLIPTSRSSSLARLIWRRESCQWVPLEL